MYFLGIDPGKLGGFSVLDEAAPLFVEKFDKTKFLDVVDFLAHEHVRTKCCLEQVHAMPRQGTVSMFHFGENFGWLQGVLDMAEIEYTQVPPQKWKKEFELSTDKQESIKVAKKLFPKVNLIPDGCRVPSDGIAESLLLAEYARRML